jgi:hypothetical protein
MGWVDLGLVEWFFSHEVRFIRIPIRHDCCVQFDCSRSVLSSGAEETRSMNDPEKLKRARGKIDPGQQAFRPKELLGTIANALDEYSWMSTAD